MIANEKGFLKKYGFCFLILAAMGAVGIMFGRWEDRKEKKYSEIEEKLSTDEDAKNEDYAEVFEKGYNLPIEDDVKKEAEKDCKAVMEKIKEIYMEADKGSADNVVISKETVSQMFSVLQETGCPVMAGGFSLDMVNYERLECFLEDSSNGIEGEIVTYEINSSGGISRKQFIFDAEDMYVLDAAASWNTLNTPVIIYTSYNRLREWDYTEKGWYLLEYCVPEPPEVSETMHGNVLIRVKPIKQEYQEISEKYLQPVGYQGNNLLRSNWDEKHMEELDYNGLFESLYFVEYGEHMSADVYEDGIAKTEFEDLMLKYLPVTVSQLETYAVYDTEKQTYSWMQLGCGNYTPTRFGTSVPEVTDIKENEDGTFTLTVDAVCEILGQEAVISHKLTVQFLEEGGIRFLKNEILDDGISNIPDYQYRFENE